MRCFLAPSSAKPSEASAKEGQPRPRQSLARAVKSGLSRRSQGRSRTDRCQNRHTLPITERHPAPRRSPARPESTELVTSRADTRSRIPLLRLPALPGTL